MRYEDVENLLKCYKSIVARASNLRINLSAALADGRAEGLDNTAEALALMHNPPSGMSYPPDGNTTDKTPRVADRYRKANADEYRELTNGLMREIPKLEGIAEKIKRSLDGIESTERQIVVMFYAENKLWREVVRRTNYSEIQCRRKRNETINKLTHTMMITDDEITLLKELSIWPELKNERKMNGF